jgi:phosphoesterase RecJ-like protein
MTKNESSLIRDIIERVESSERVLLSSHQGPDGDSLGSQISFYLYLKSLGKQVWMYNQGHIPHYFHDFKEIDLVKCEPEDWIVPEQGFDLAVIFECTSIDRIGEVKDIVAPKTDIINIDHHRENSEFGLINYIDVNASSVGEMNYRIFKQAGLEISREIAEYIFIAILTDTGRFHFTSTTPESLRVAAELIEQGIDIKALTDRIYFSNSEAQLRLTGELLASMDVVLGGRACLLTLTRSDLERYGLKYGDMEGMVEWTMKVKGAMVGALLKDLRPDFTKISLRSQRDIDVHKLAQKFDGGGHLNAAGCHIHAPLPEAKEKLISAIGELIEDVD